MAHLNGKILTIKQIRYFCCNTEGCAWLQVRMQHRASHASPRKTVPVPVWIYGIAAWIFCQVSRCSSGLVSLEWSSDWIQTKMPEVHSSLTAGRCFSMNRLTSTISCKSQKHKWIKATSGVVRPAKVLPVPSLAATFWPALTGYTRFFLPLFPSHPAKNHMWQIHHKKMYILAFLSASSP